MAKVRKLCPTVKELDTEIQRNVPCLVTGCDRIFSQGAARRLHMVKVHKFIEVRIFTTLSIKKYHVWFLANFYRPPTKLREGSVFSRVCLSVGSQAAPGYHKQFFLTRKFLQLVTIRFQTDADRAMYTRTKKKPEGGDDVIDEFHCPVTSCYFNIASPRHFTSFTNLKNVSYHTRRA